MKAELIVPTVMLFVPLRAQWITLERGDSEDTGRESGSIGAVPRTTTHYRTVPPPRLRTPDFQMTLEDPKTDSVPTDVTTFPISSISVSVRP
jgi:hypothetical protein